MKWRRRKRGASSEVLKLQSQRRDAEARLAESALSLEITTRDVIQPLRRTRHEMLQENHVIDNLVQRLTGGAHNGA